MKKLSLLLAFALAMLAGETRADLIAQWTFETSVPTSAGPHQAEGGLLAASSFASGFHVSGSTVYSNPVGNGSVESFSSNFWSTGDYYQFTTDLTGYSNVEFSWSQTRSGTGPSGFDLLVSIDGVNFTNLTSYVVDQVAWSSAAPQAASDYSFNLSNLIANQANVTVRLVQTSATGATAGTNRVDNVSFNSIAIPEPGLSVLALTGLACAFAARRRK